MLIQVFNFLQSWSWLVGVSAHPFLSLPETASRLRFVLDGEKNAFHTTQGRQAHTTFSLSLRCLSWRIVVVELVSSCSRLSCVLPPTILSTFISHPFVCHRQVRHSIFSNSLLSDNLLCCERESLTGKSCFIRREKVAAAFLTINLLDLFCVINSLLDPASLPQLSTATPLNSHKEVPNL